jgi:hypothetical protein
MTDAVIAEHPTAKYMTFSGAEGNLLLFFLLLTQAGSNLIGQWADLLPYIQRSQWKADLD